MGSYFNFLFKMQVYNKTRVSYIGEWVHFNSSLEEPGKMKVVSLQSMKYYRFVTMKI